MGGAVPDEKYINIIILHLIRGGCSRGGGGGALLRLNRTAVTYRPDRKDGENKEKKEGE